MRLQDKSSNIGINYIFTSSEKLEIEAYKTILQHQKSVVPINKFDKRYILPLQRNNQG